MAAREPRTPAQQERTNLMGLTQYRDPAAAVHADGDRRAAGRRARLVDQARRRPAAGARLPDCRGHHGLPGREPGSRRHPRHQARRRRRRHHQRHRLHPVELGRGRLDRHHLLHRQSPQGQLHRRRAPRQRHARPRCPPTPRTRPSANTIPTPSRSCSSPSSGNRDLGALQRLAEDKIEKRLEAPTASPRSPSLGGLVREIQVQVDQQRCRRAA